MYTLNFNNAIRKAWFDTIANAITQHERTPPPFVLSRNRRFRIEASFYLIQFKNSLFSSQPLLHNKRLITKYETNFIYNRISARNGAMPG